MFVVRRASRDAPFRAALSLPDGLHVTLDEAGVVWQSRPDGSGEWVPAEEALSGGAERGSSVALSSLAVLEDGSVATRWADGAAEALMKDGSAGFFGGRARGWVWTNSKGLRQVASPPSHEARLAEPCPVRTGPVPEPGRVSTGEKVNRI